MDETRLLLAIDGGQTSTKALLATAGGTILATGRGGPSDHFHIEGGVEKNRVAIHGAIFSALEAAQVGPERIAAIGLGLTGAPPEGDQNPVVQEVVREALPHLSDAKIVVLPDYKTNLAGASGGAGGVVLIAGGGAIGYGITEDGREAISGGFGFLIGDEGSAFDIGLRAIEAAAKAADLRGEPTVLEAIVREHFGIAKMRDLTRIVYKAGFSRDQISLLAPKVAEAAREGDAAAVAVIRHAADELAKLALGVIRQLYEPGAAVRVYLTGGVFTGGDLLLDLFTAHLQAAWPEAEAVQPRFPPAVGGLIMAARAAGIEPDETWLERVGASLPPPSR